MSDSYRIGDQNALHYTTIATIGWVDLFTKRKNKNILIDSLKYCQTKKGLEVFGFCIMSNHIHLICSTRNYAEFEPVMEIIF